MSSPKAQDAAIPHLPDSFYEPFLSQLALRRKPSPIRALMPLEQTPGLISLLAGKPNPATFPFTSLSFEAPSPFAESSSGAGDIQKLSVDPAELAAGLQYSATSGTPQLLSWLVGLQERFHGRSFFPEGTEGGKVVPGKVGVEGWRISVGSGSQDLIFKTVQTLVDPGDAVLVESPVYAGVIPMFENMGCEQIEVETDAHGICSSSLRTILENWPAEKKKPRILYTVPYGCNPTGMTATLERRKEVLELSKQHNFLILEDDPYFYLYYGPTPRPPSYFALEKSFLGESGRVVRFDSFSKILSAGIRIGWVSGPGRVLGGVDGHTATSNLQSSSLTQAITSTLLHAWGYDGFSAHVARVAGFYKEKRDVFERAMHEILGGGGEKGEGGRPVAEWVRPEAGMFFWFKLLTPTEDSQATIESTAFKRGVLALPGTVFLPNGRKTAYVRASFSLLEGEGEVREALGRLREAVLDDCAM